MTLKSGPNLNTLTLLCAMISSPVGCLTLWSQINRKPYTREVRRTKNSSVDSVNASFKSKGKREKQTSCLLLISFCFQKSLRIEFLRLLPQILVVVDSIQIPNYHSSFWNKITREFHVASCRVKVWERRSWCNSECFLQHCLRVWHPGQVFKSWKATFRFIYM